jgi:hypothetical protein
MTDDTYCGAEEEAREYTRQYRDAIGAFCDYPDLTALLQRAEAHGRGDADKRERILIDALKKCRNLTHMQHTDIASVRETGERVATVVSEAFLLVALTTKDTEETPDE